jgi:cytochrome P450
MSFNYISPAQRSFENMVASQLHMCLRKIPCSDWISSSRWRDWPKSTISLKALKQLFDTYGNTYSSTSLGTTAISTIEPQNIQIVWASRFKDYGIEPFRLLLMEPFTGRGILNSDGPHWEHSRALIRPTFNKANLANLAVFELHLRKLIEIIPRDESTVNLR